MGVRTVVYLTYTRTLERWALATQARSNRRRSYVCATLFWPAPRGQHPAPSIQRAAPSPAALNYAAFFSL